MAVLRKSIVSHLIIDLMQNGVKRYGEELPRAYCRSRIFLEGQLSADEQ